MRDGISSSSFQVCNQTAFRRVVIIIIGGGQDGAVASNASTISELIVSHTQHVGAIKNEDTS